MLTILYIYLAVAALAVPTLALDAKSLLAGVIGGLAWPAIVVGKVVAP